MIMATPPSEETTVPLLLSLVAQESPGGMFSMILLLSFDDIISSSVEETIDHPSALMAPLLAKFHHQFLVIKTKWNPDFTKVEACCGLIINNI